MLQILSPTWEATSPENPALTWKSITDFPKPTLHLETQEENLGPTRNQPRDMVYMAVVLTVLLYACESWIVYNRHA